jgi:mRNA interferase RelE/StbE
VPRYQVELLDHQVRRQLDRIPDPDFGRIAQALLKLEADPRPAGCRKLQHLEGWRLRCGDWRVIYTIDDQEHLVTIVDIKRRRENTYR